MAAARRGGFGRGGGSILLCVATGENNLRTEREKKSPYAHLMRRNTSFVPPPSLANQTLFIRQSNKRNNCRWSSSLGLAGRRSGSAVNCFLHVVCGSICSLKPCRGGSKFVRFNSEQIKKHRKLMLFTLFRILFPV